MVNCTLWVPREATPDLPPGHHILLSGAADNTIRCWLVAYSPPPPSAAGGAPDASPATRRAAWKCLAVLQGHAAPVTSLAVHRLPSPAAHESAGTGTSPDGSSSSGSGSGAAAGGPRLLLVSTAGDSDVIVWACGAAGAAVCSDAVPSAEDAGGRSAAAEATGEEPAAGAGAAAGSEAEAAYGQACWALEQRIAVGTRMQTTAALTHLPLDPDWTLLATGGTDRKVHLHVRPPGPTGRFAPACVLEGHENWVRGVAFCHVAAPAPAGAPPAAAGHSGGGGGDGAAGEGGGAGSIIPELLLASVSQDRYGRIWRLQPQPLGGAAGDRRAGTGAGPAVAAGGSGSSPTGCCAGGPGGDGAAQRPEEGEREDPLAELIRRYAPKPHIDTLRSRYVATSEALLIGHEDWVHSLQWAPVPQPPAGGGGGGGGAGGRAHTHTRTSAALLTASMDRTMVIWRYEPASGLWMNEASLGDAGASCLGYFGGVWGPGGGAILAHGFTGALHLWRRPPPPAPPAAADAGSALGHGPWLPVHAMGGHWGPVVDCGWGLDGGCLLSVSEDQTARLHAGTAWRPGGGGGGAAAGSGRSRAAGAAAAAAEGDEAATEEGAELHWCEVARAQIHGHDFRCVAVLPTPPGANYAYVSGAEEKVLRVLEAPQAFIDTLVALRGGEGSPGGRVIVGEGRRGHGFGAAVAALGLSNKAVFEEDAAGGNAGVGSGMPGGDYADGPDFAPCAAPQVVTEPPLEEHLAQNTLWPETYKLYGHGNDVFCAAASPDGTYLASACKAQTASTATIWVWCTRSWRPVAQLKAHTLTVTQLEWSPSGSLLAAASRDRTFSIFRRRDPSPSAAVAEAADGGGGGGGAKDGENATAFELVCRIKSAHGRVIWSVSWSLDERLLATASRDETVKIWRLSASAAAEAPPAPTLAATLPQFPCAATAVAFAPRMPPQHAAAAAGGGGAMDTSSNGPSAESNYLLAVGLKDGSVQLWKLAEAVARTQPEGQEGVCSCVWEAGAAWRHAGAVRRLRWRGAPGTGARPGTEAGDGEGQRPLQLASCSDDHSVRVFTFRGA